MHAIAMKEDFMASLGDGFKDIFLAGVGALAFTGEKAKEVVDQLIAKGELTVDQGKELNEQLRHQASERCSSVSLRALEAHLSTLSPDERTAFAAKIADLLAKESSQKAEGEVGFASGVEVNEELHTTEVPQGSSAPHHK